MPNNPITPSIVPAKKAFVHHGIPKSSGGLNGLALLGRLVFVESGIIHLKTEQATYLVPAGYFAWLPAGQDHALDQIGQNCLLRNVCFETNFCNNPAFHQMAIFSGSKLFCDMVRHTAKWSGSETEDVYEITFLTVLRQMLPAEMAKSFLISLPSSKDERISTLLGHIHRHLHEPVGINVLAAMANLSLRTLQRLFASETGLSFSTYLKLMRIMKAVELLATTDMRVSEVAWAVGYNSVPTFNLTFRTVTGYRPEHFQLKN